jgi:hypothetical protein
MRTCFAFTGDEHHGLRFGLLAPGVELEYKAGDKTPVSQSDCSKWLWDAVYLPGIEAAITFAGKSPLYILDNGDIVHGSRFQEYLYSSWQKHQELMAEMSLAAWRIAPTLAGFVFTYGTDAHDYGEGIAVENIAADIAAWGLPVKVSAHHMIGVDRMGIDLAHHGPPAGSGPNAGHAARMYTQARVRQAMERGESPPGVLLRGHVHQDFCEFVYTRWGRDTFQRTLTIIGAPLCGTNGFAIQHSRSADRIRCGMFMFAVDGGEVTEWQAFLRERDTRTYYVFEPGTQGHKYKGTPRPKNGRKKKACAKPSEKA